MDIKEKASKIIAERLNWNIATRDQAGVAKKLADNQPADEVFGLGDAGLFDMFFYFLRELGFMEILEQLEPKSCRKRKSPVP
ncbi:MAG: hypothetical protein D3916_07190, partial [Candidatus Electrothrix sp. MAN1_4]|nr:hypothetical protein [Candidatus Electrothrix sp. MAN1_4]